MDKTSLARRALLKRATIMLVSVAALPVALSSRPAVAGAARGAEFHYQDHPKDGKRCADCTAFGANAREPNAEGTCRIITGPISPAGWCMAFSKR